MSFYVDKIKFSTAENQAKNSLSSNVTKCHHLSPKNFQQLFHRQNLPFKRFLRYFKTFPHFPQTLLLLLYIYLYNIVFPVLNKTAQSVCYVSGKAKQSFAMQNAECRIIVDFACALSEARKYSWGTKSSIITQKTHR